MISGPGRQRGASFGLVMIVLLLVVFFGNLLVTMMPAYMTFWQLRSTMNALADKPDVIGGGPRVIMSTLSAQLGINNVRAVKMDAFDMEKTNDGWKLSTAYDVQKPVMANVDVIMHFAHSVELEKP